MTILGAIVQPDRALLWCDTETYVSDLPRGEFPKMGVNPLGIVSIGAGPAPLIRACAAIVQTRMNIDDVERDMPDELRKCAAKIAPDLVSQDQEWFEGLTAVAVGFSPTAGRMLGWQFAGGTFLEPVLLSRLSSPSDDSINALVPSISALDHIVRIARRQMVLLRAKGLQGASGCSLTVAEVTETTLRCWRIPDFDIDPLTASAPGGVELHRPAGTSADAVGLEQILEGR